MMQPDRSRHIQIVLATLLMGATVYVLGNNLMADREAPVTPSTSAAREPELVPEPAVVLKDAGMFEEPLAAESVKQSDDKPVSKRDLAQFYSRRAYPGAPPIIPHEVLDKKGIGGNTCTGCHAQGGYVPQFKAYAPVTPHPQWSNCVQCHVPAAEKTRFRETAFVPAARPTLVKAALAGGPPAVPHSLEYRSACQSCHAGPGAVKEIRTPHPERQNCRQCHVSHESDHGAFERRQP